ncbi:MAG: SDR family NAD(P)-dependent oxidoreductase [Planctomycetota bacterium]|nr:MAG: SDR family NAD(P)-dependent oxidoreductase [Planctomycetota bacterium]REJ87894.1 MAG: SDR family NAD(P)-dependent oxidoreductase [Planctomycetota bacterium]REK26470.1 MAG: SDR family NAD(P)-dependent oxidoreductase [Planctomycetota bacterium]REK38692.1 MAG: SDR family NAD(P)-dependent oxidoreductase [Planctomycetota bacterium]
MEISGKSFLVTGGASGLGAATTRRLVAEGGSVLVADVNEAAGAELVAELSGDGPGRALFQHTDVTDEASLKAAVDVAVAQHGGLDGAALCAGILGAARIVGRDGPHDLKLYRRVVEVNLVGTFNALRLAAAAMARGEASAADGERGVVVMTSSVAAFDGQLGQAAYAASKGGVASMALPAARELGKLGVRVAAIAPGVFATPMMGELPDDYRTSLEAQVPFPPRLGQPEEFAALVAHIFENRMLNGCVLRLDGALRMAAK